MTRVLLAFALVLTTATAHAQIDRGPYVQMGTPDSTVVAWRTATAADSRVCYGSSPSMLTSTAMGPAGVRQHEVRITGLTPMTRYYYAAGVSSCPPAAAGNMNHHFTTSAPAGMAEPLRLWIVGDSGTGGTRQGQVRDAMLAAVGPDRPDLFLHLGDMAYGDGTTAEFDAKFYAMYDSILENIVVWPTMGNHEGHTSDSNAGTGSGPYYDGYVLPTMGQAGGVASGTEAFYSFDWGNVHFIVLESYEIPRDPGAAMWRWLTMDLMSTDQPWVIAYWHHPPYTKGSHDSDTEGELIDMREVGLPILEGADVDVVLGGHSHIYERSWLINGAYDTPTTAGGHILDMGDGSATGDGPYDMDGPGAVYIVAGHGGTGCSMDARHPLMLRIEPVNGSVIADIDGTTAHFRNIRWDGMETDAFDLVHGSVMAGDTINLSAPAGGETYLVGSDVEVRWSTTGMVGPVRIEFSLDGGMYWAPVIDSTENDGSHVWTTPENPTTNARIRIAEVARPVVRDESRDFILDASAEVTVIPLGGVWEYRDTGTDEGDAWRTTTGGGWASGMAQLGYGEGDEATMLMDRDPNIPTYYFRQGVRIDGEITGARVRGVFDDGIAVFVNGTQVFARNVGATDFAAWSTTQSMDNEAFMQMLDLSGGNPFVAGDNVIGAIVKQANDTSSDLSFDLELVVSTTRTDLDPIPWPPAGGGDAGPGGGRDGGPTGDRDGGGTGPRPDPSDEGGCGCHVPASGRGGAAPAAALLAGVLAFVLRLSSRRARRASGG